MTAMIRTCISTSSVTLSMMWMRSCRPSPQQRHIHTFRSSSRALHNKRASNILKPTTKLFNQSRYRFASNINGSDGNNLNGDSQDILNSTAATTEWKRNHYRKISDKFQPDTSSSDDNAKKYPEPLQIDSYDDVQPMWKEMESRVTRRRSLTLDQRGGVNGRRNVRKSDEEFWLEAGVYDGGGEGKEGEKKD